MGWSREVRRGVALLSGLAVAAGALLAGTLAGTLADLPPAAGLAHAVAVAPLVLGDAPPADRVLYRFAVAGRPRVYAVVGGRSGPTRPLLVALPGLGQSAAQAERIQGWDRYAATGRAVVVYGSSNAGAWDAGTCCTRRAGRPAADDVAYLDQVITRVSAAYPVDRRRVYLVGFSNGGMMAYRYACERSRRLAAVAVVAGTLAYPGCRPASALDVLAVNGTADRTVPLAGARLSRRLHVPLLPPAEGLRPFERAALGTPARVRLLVVGGLDHHWPLRRAARRLAGTPVIWDFLSRAAQRAAPAPLPRVGNVNGGASGRGRYLAR